MSEWEDAESSFGWQVLVQPKGCFLPWWGLVFTQAGSSTLEPIFANEPNSDESCPNRLQDKFEFCMPSRLKQADEEFKKTLFSYKDSILVLDCSTDLFRMWLNHHWNVSFFQNLIWKAEREGEGEERERKKIFHLLIHFPNAYSNQGQAGLKPQEPGSQSGLPQVVRDPNPKTFVCCRKMSAQEEGSEME